MEISLSRFAQLTAMIAAGGTLVTACTVNNVHEDAGTGGSTGTVNPATGGATSAAGSSSQATTAAATGGTAAGTSALATGGTTNGTTAQAGSTSTGGATGIGGVTSTATSSAVTGGAGGADTTSTGTNITAGGAGGVATTVASSSATGGATTSASTGTQSTATGGTSAVATTVVSTGGTTAVVTTGTNPDAGTNGCVSGEPAAEGYGFNCSNLAFYFESCPDPTVEGEFSYGAKWCNVYAAERVDAVKVFTDCLQNLQEPTTGWCGTEQKAAVDACRNQMLTQTCPSTAAQTACENIGAACPAVNVADCVADLSPLSDATISYIEPCMEGAPISDCEAVYQRCAKFPDQGISVTTTCGQLTQACSELDLATCQTTLDSYGTGTISYYLYETLLVTCTDALVEFGYPCAEAFMDCTINW